MWPSSTGKAGRSPWRRRPRYHPPVFGRGPLHRREFTTSSLWKQAIRCPDPFVRLSGKWLVRQLAPDSSPIEIETMSGQKGQDKLLHAMAWEAANVHLGTPRAAALIAADLNRRSGNWLRTAVKDMAAAIIGDWKEWKESQP